MSAASSHTESLSVCFGWLVGWLLWLLLRAWLQESVALNEAAVGRGMNFEQVLCKLRTICLALPNTKETLTWGIPHIRVGEKIFCGCAEDKEILSSLVF